MFWDLNIPYNSQTNSALLPFLIKYGYDGIALNLTISNDSHLKGNSPESIVSSLNESKDQPKSESLMGSVASGLSTLRLEGGSTVKKDLKVLSRVTIKLDDKNQHIVNKSNIQKSFDILAVDPGNDRVFLSACTAMEVDIISIDLSQKLAISLAKKLPSIKAAIKRGIYFEICYTQALGNPVEFRTFMNNAQSFVRWTKGKNLLLSSQAREAMLIRAPYDAMNLMTILGINISVAKEMISTNAQSVISHGFTRKTHFAVLHLQNLAEIGPTEQWKLAPENKVAESKAATKRTDKEETSTSVQQKKPKQTAITKK